MNPMLHAPLELVKSFYRIAGPLEVRSHAALDRQTFRKSSVNIPADHAKFSLRHLLAPIPLPILSPRVVASPLVVVTGCAKRAGTIAFSPTKIAPHDFLDDHRQTDYICPQSAHGNCPIIIASRATIVFVARSSRRHGGDKTGSWAWSERKLNTNLNVGMKQRIKYLTKAIT